ncbi:MAG: protein kinase, partial [Gemmataceae bacterium]|nr:protein kinase [Gemmataceae bacterium]
LADRLRDGPLRPREAAELIRTVADAVHAAHEANLVHRDLKPANVLFTNPQVDRSPESRATSAAGSSSTGSGSRQSPFATAKVADFGLVKDLAQVGLSQSGEMIGTPSYMAPEQASGAKRVGPPADIYALGAILYECLTGRPPFEGDNPISILMLVANSDPVHPARLRPGIPRDLESVCLKCLEKSPGRRYASARLLADDLERFLNGQSTEARPLSLAGRVVKLVRRHPVTTGLLCSVAVSLVIGMLGVLWQWRAAVAARREEAAQRAVAEQNLYTGRLAQAILLWESGDTEQARRVLDNCRPAPGRANLRGCEWNYLTRVFQPETRVDRVANWVNSLVLIPGQVNEVAAAIGRPRYTVTQEIRPDDGLTLITSSEGHRRFGPEVLGGASCVAASPSGRILAWGTTAGQVVIADSSGQLLHRLSLRAEVAHLTFVGNTETLLAACVTQPSFVAEIDCTRGAVIREVPFQVGRPVVMAGSHATQAIAVAGWSVLRFADWPQLENQNRVDLRPAMAAGLATAPDGQQIALGSTIGTVTLYRTADREQIRRWQAHPGPVYAVAWSRDGATLFTGGADKTICAWRAATGQLIRTWRGHESAVRCIAVDPNDIWMVSGGQDGTIRWWDLKNVGTGKLLTFDNRLNDILVTNDTVTAVALNGKLTRWNIADGSRQFSTTADIQARPIYPARYTGFLAEPDVVFGIRKDRTIEVGLWSATDGRLVRSWANEEPVYALGSDPAGQYVVWAAKAGEGSVVRCWDSKNKLLTGPWPLSGVRVRCIGIDSTGRAIGYCAVEANPAAMTVVGSIDVATGSTREITRGRGAWTAPVFRPDGREVAVTVDGTVRGFSWPDLQPRFELPCDKTNTCLAYHPDSSRLATIGYDGIITLFDPINRQQIVQIRGLAPPRPEDMAADCRVAFSPDGTRLVSSNWDGSINIFDLRPLSGPRE